MLCGYDEQRGHASECVEKLLIQTTGRGREKFEF